MITALARHRGRAPTLIMDKRGRLSYGPLRQRSFKTDDAVVLGMTKLNSPGVQAQRIIVDAERLPITQAVPPIKRIPDDRPTQVRQV